MEATGVYWKPVWHVLEDSFELVLGNAAHNLKLGSVLSDVLGDSGRAMLKAIVSGEDDPVRLASLAQGHARRKTSELREALSGRVTAHHRAMLGLHLQVIDALERALADLDAAVGLALTPIRQHVQLLRTIPGVGDLTARVLVAEIGVDMTRFPNRFVAHHDLKLEQALADIAQAGLEAEMPAHSSTDDRRRTKASVVGRFAIRRSALRHAPPQLRDRVPMGLLGSLGEGISAPLAMSADNPGNNGPPIKVFISGRA